MKCRLLSGEWVGAATWLFGLLGLLVPAPAISAEAARAMPSGGFAKARKRSHGSTADRTSRWRTDRRKTGGALLRAADLSADIEPLRLPKHRRRFDSIAPAMEVGAESRTSPRPVASQATARPISKQQPETGRTQAADRTAAFAAARPAGPVLKPAQPPTPLRQVSSRAHLIRQEAVPPGTATRNEMSPAPGVSSRRVQTPFGPGADGSITLNQASELAIQYNPILRSAAAQIESARGQAVQAGLWNNPRWDTNNPQVLASGPNNQYNAGFQLEIPVAGKKRLDRGAVEQQVRQAVFDYRTDRMNMLTSVRQQFYGLLAQQRRVEISRRASRDRPQSEEALRRR